jgi:hypothetical protein
LAQSRVCGTESEFPILGRQCTDRRFPGERALVDEVTAWRGERNAGTARIDWRLTSADARTRPKRPYPTLHD